ncbi:MAG: SUMF1/EgtB/PvdO family nonheme iron enzyme [Deltaproteobacteria bacterium]|nr:SUMF1/EgtB/PvdO family nonheme iron enzyme [Deltaproteobacteria bacterium]
MSAKRFLGTLSLLVLTGCPYTEGCEAPREASTAEALPSTPADGGAREDATTTTNEPPGQVDGGANLGPTQPNCAGLTAKCAGESCCTIANVPGGTFNRLNDAAFPATVSDFRLDKYEVTVGRFRAFVNAGKGTKKSAPAVGSGAHPKIPGTGWKAEYTAMLTDDTPSLADAVKCDPTLYNEYSDTPGVNDTLPMNCVTWAEAYAFCIWDGGRLPTETEWNYAAAGGGEQRAFPWGGTAMDATRGAWGCQSGDSIAEPGAPACKLSDYTAVGTHPAGAGRWGHMDMAGGVWERVLDSYADPFRTTPCNDCAETATVPEGTVIRGGSLNWAASYLRTFDRSMVNSEPYETRTNTVGFRCARD